MKWDGEGSVGLGWEHAAVAGSTRGGRVQWDRRHFSEGVLQEGLKETGQAEGLPLKM